MVEYSRYGRERLPSEQVEKLRTNFACALSTRTPEPRLEAALETSQPVTTASSQPALPKRKRKRKRNKTNFLHKHKPYDTSPEPKLDVAVETSQPMTTASSQPAPPTRKRKRTTDFLRELEPNKESPELESASGPETHRPITRDSSQPPPRKRKRRSKMLRELDPHNESPEQDSEPDIGILHDSTKGPFFTRSAAHKVVSFLKNKTPTPPKDLNLDRLMYAELKGMQKGTKTWYFPGDTDPGSSSQQRQPESGQGTVVDIKEESEEEALPKDVKASGRNRSQPSSTRLTLSQQPRSSSETGERDQAVAVESAWSMWDREKGKSSFNSKLAVPLLWSAKT